MSTPPVPWHPENPTNLAKLFARLGWIGLWIQIVLLVIPILLLVYVQFFSSPETVQRRGIDLGNYLSYGSLLVLLFTTFWFFRYTRLAKRILNPEVRPDKTSLENVLWIGLWAGFLGILFSTGLLFGAVGRMVFVFLANPQTGLQIAPAAGGDPAMALSALDALSLVALLITVTAELIVLAFTLWLLFRVTRTAGETVASTTGH